MIFLQKGMLSKKSLFLSSRDSFQTAPTPTCAFKTSKNEYYFPFSTLISVTAAKATRILAHPAIFLFFCFGFFFLDKIGQKYFGLLLLLEFL